jgi:hypothetical protein
VYQGVGIISSSRGRDFITFALALSVTHVYV